MAALSVNDIRVLIGVIQDDIRNDNIESLEKNLNRIPLGRLPVKHYDNLAAIFVNLAAKWNRSASLDVILKVFSENNLMEEKRPFLTHIFKLYKVSDEALAFVGKNADYLYANYMFDLIDDDSSPEVMMACKRLTDVFGEQPPDVYQNLYDTLREQEMSQGFPNYYVLEFVKEKMEQTSDYTPKPDYVADYGLGPERSEGRQRQLPRASELHPPEPPKIMFQLPNTERAVELLTEGLKELGVDPDKEQELRDRIYAQVAISTLEEKIELLKPVFKAKATEDLSGDQTIFRILGPVNPMYNIDLSEETRCAKYGGCRMFSCVEFENYDEDYGVIDEDLDVYANVDSFIGVDWFRGACDFCHKRIQQPAYAVRRPMIMGGWMGCYCSWKCVTEDVPNEDVLTLMLIGRIQKQMTEIGIQDRIDDIG